MPRDLSDVIHYFIPESEADADADAGDQAEPAPVSVRPRNRGKRIDLVPTSAQAGNRARREARRRLGALPIVAVPIADRDVVRAAFTWNLAVEVARMGGRGVVVTPSDTQPSPLWPEAGIGPMGAEVVPTPASDLGALYRVAIDVAVARTDLAAEGGLVFVRVPTSWLAAKTDGAGLLRWVLLFSLSSRASLRECFDTAQRVARINPKAQIGVTIHGARKRGEAEDAFTSLARATRKRIGHSLLSYGLLVDDLHVYRAIVAQRPIGLAHPQSPAARALRDVAQLLSEAARKRAVA